MMKRLVLVLMLAGLASAGSFRWAYTDADSAAVHSWWRAHITRVRLGSGVRGTIGADSATMHAYGKFTPAELRMIRAAFDSLGVVYGDSIPFIQKGAGNY